MQTTPNPTPTITPRRGGLAHAIAFVRTAIYSVTATAFFILMTVLCSFVLLLPPQRVRGFLNAWAAGDVVLLRLIVGQRIRVLGRENIPDGPALIASKHQAAWETLAHVFTFPRGVMILKKELLKIPLYGKYASHFGMIAVDRSAGPAALKQLAIDAAATIKQGLQVIIFPEGTRRPVGAPPDYKPGAVFLYEKLGVPIVPVALNSGLLWPLGRFAKFPGTITVSIMPAIPPGLGRAEVKARLVAAVEGETDRLVAAGSGPA